MSPLRVLLVLPDPPIPFGNAAARWFYVLLRGLLERGHRVTAFVSCADSRDVERVRELFPSGEADVRCHVYRERAGLRAKWSTFRRPRSYPFTPELIADLECEITRGYDVLHLEQHWTGWVGLRHAGRALLNVHYLYGIDTADLAVDSYLGRLRHRAVLRAERRVLRHFPRITAVTPRLRDAVAEINPRATVHHVPLGLDLSLYPFEPDGGRADGGPVVGLIGSFSWQPTYTAGQRLVTRLWPAIRARVPGVRLCIAGRDARTALREHLDAPGVEIHENVREIIPYFRGLDVMLYAPSRGSGLKVKVQEAFALGVPVVTTGEGVEGIPAVDGLHAGVCEDDAGLIERTVELLRDPALRTARRVAARALLERHCDAGATVEGIERIHAEMVCSQGARHSRETAPVVSAPDPRTSER